MGLCYFDRGKNACAILAGEKRCNGCKFFKTDVQFEVERNKARKTLSDRGLESYESEGHVRTRKHE